LGFERIKAKIDNDETEETINRLDSNVKQNSGNSSKENEVITNDSELKKF